MAPRKKKDSGTMSGLPKSFPYVTIGTHLTVIEHENGRTELIWDDDALLKEVQDAILSVEQAKKPAKKSTRKPKEKNV